MNPRPVRFMCEVHMNTSHQMSLKAGFGMRDKVIFLSSLLSLFSKCCLSPLVPVSAGRWWRTEACVREEAPFPLHRAGTGVICRTINTFMNIIKVLTSSYMRFRVTREMYFRSEETELWKCFVWKWATYSKQSTLKGWFTQITKMYFLNLNLFLLKTWLL